MKKLCFLVWLLCLMPTLTFAVPYDADNDGYIDESSGGTNTSNHVTVHPLPTSRDTRNMDIQNIGTGANNYIELNNSGELPFSIDINDLTDTGNLLTTQISGTSNLGISAISSATCATVVTTTATGVVTTDVITWGFNSDPTGVTGYSPTANGMLTIIIYPTVNNVNFKVCNLTAASITPGAVTLNWKVIK